MNILKFLHIAKIWPDHSAHTKSSFLNAPFVCSILFIPDRKKRSVAVKSTVRYRLQKRDLGCSEVVRKIAEYLNSPVKFRLNILSFPFSTSCLVQISQALQSLHSFTNYFGVECQDQAFKINHFWKSDSLKFSGVWYWSFGMNCC